MNRQLRSILEETEGGRRYLAQIDGEKRARARRVAAKPKAPGRSREDRRQQHREETAELRRHAFEKWGGRCLCCMSLLSEAWHLHHIESGGLRRSRQTKGNTVPLCEACHRLAHRGDLGTLEALQRWAEVNGDPSARTALARRVAKVVEARGASRALEGRR